MLARDGLSSMTRQRARSAGSARRALWLGALALAGCGARSELAGSLDARADARDEADAVRTPPEASPGPEVGVVTSPCRRVLEDPSTAPDALVFQCGLERQLGSCFVQPRCPECACEFYVKGGRCDSSGVCGPPLDGNGCISIGSWNIPPWNCTATTYEGTAACVLRVLLRTGGVCTS